MNLGGPRIKLTLKQPQIIIFIILRDRFRKAAGKRGFCANLQQVAGHKQACTHPGAPHKNYSKLSVNWAI